MLEFARQPSADLRRFFQEAGAQRGIAPHIVEKDFWVCWLLRLVFSDPKLGGHLVFKGGTSLSKVFGLIQRFSEDIDLSVDPAWLGFAGTARPDAAPNRTQFDKRERALEDACIAAIRDRFATRLEGHIQTHLPGHPEAALRFEVDAITHSPVLLFAYPHEGTTGSLRPEVKLEFGSLYDQRPVAPHMIRPLAAEVLPDLFREPTCPVVALEAERTFWEKATLLHAECHRPPDKPSPPGISRHFYDLAMIARHETGRRAVADVALLAQVREHKQTYFRSGWAHYDSAKPGSFRLVPDSERIAPIRQDYRRMEDMFMAPPPPFETILSELKALEGSINGN